MNQTANRQKRFSIWVESLLTIFLDTIFGVWTLHGLILERNFSIWLLVVHEPERGLGASLDP